MGKQSIHVRLDHSVYLDLKSRDLNMTETINNLLRNYLDQENIETDESVVVHNISKIRSEIKDLESKLESEVVKLQIIRERKAKEEKEHDEKLQMMARSMKVNNPLRDMDL